MLNFNPMTNEEYESIQNPFPEGEYEFITEMCESKVSSTGNTMLVAYINIFSPLNNRSMMIKDYILPDHPQMKFRLKQFCESISLEKEYESGKLDLESMRGKGGKCWIRREKEKDGDRTFCKIKSYTKCDLSTDKEFDDDITF